MTDDKKYLADLIEQATKLCPAPDQEYAAPWIAHRPEDGPRLIGRQMYNGQCVSIVYWHGADAVSIWTSDEAKRELNAFGYELEFAEAP